MRDAFDRRIGQVCDELPSLRRSSLQLQPRVEGQLEPRIQKLVSLVDKILVDQPWLVRSVNEAIDPIRNLK